MNSLNVVIACAICLVGIMFSVNQLGSKKQDLLNPALLITFPIIIGFGLNTIYWHFFDVPTEIVDLSSLRNQETVLKTLLTTLVGLVSFCVSFSLANISRKRFEESKSNSLDPFKISILIYLVTPFIVFSAIQVLEQIISHGLGGYMRRNRYEKAENAYISFIASSVQLYILVSLHIASRVKEVGKVTNSLLAGLMVISLVVCISSGFRGTVIVLVLHLIAIRHYRYKRISKKGGILFVVIALLVLGVLGNIRKEIELASQGAISTQGIGLQFEKTLDEVFKRLQGVEIVSLVIQNVEQGEPYKYFYDAIFESITIIIPRSVWPEKPESQSIVFGATFLTDYLMARDGSVGFNTGGFSYNLIGYLFWQAGYLGVIFGMATLGAILKNVYQVAELHNFQGSVGVFYITIYARLWTLAEAPQECMNQIIFTLVFVTIIVVFSKERNPSKNGFRPISTGEGGCDANRMMTGR